MPFALLLLAVLPALPDSVALKSGVVVECDVLSKSEQILKVHSARFQRVMMIDREQIDYVEMEGARYTFETLKLEKTDYNPKFRISPRLERRKSAVKPAAPSSADAFDLAGKINNDSVSAEHRRLNLFFNAPARWGSLGFGYFFAQRLLPPDPENFVTYGFDYRGGPLDLKQLSAQIRRNFQGGLGSLVVDMGYGKKVFALDSVGGIKEAAFMRFAALKYVYCHNRWLLSPGLSAGLMFVKAGVIRYRVRLPSTPAKEEGPNLNFSLYRYGVVPVVGFDLNFYDVLDVNVSADVWDLRRSYINLVFLIPFLQ